MVWPSKSMPLASTFSITHWGTGLFPGDSQHLKQITLRGHPVPLGKEAAPQRRACPMAWGVLSVLSTHTLPLLGGPRFGAEAVSDFLSLWLNN